MNKTRFILLVTVAAMVLMGAAYAAWTQTFTISSTVDTGELFVKISEVNKVEVDDGKGSYTTAGNSYLDLSNLVNYTTARNADGTQETLSTLSYDIDKVYPGTRLTTTLTFTNMGTMRTKIAFNEAASQITNAGNELWKDLVFTVNGTPVIVSDAATAKTSIANAIMNEIGAMEPGATKTVTIVQELPLSSTNETEKLNLQWTMSFIFQQYNN
ncbi:hypothetical protein CDQ84_16720 [Clostridium thermosuccinogenes]|uniref:Uncharacterized protein n=1 Tax=Clostridium thermosuccinogenes TaxID=84032 RepID=A0A2K2EV54_9CLOT|nr:hypothetical protein [Pseudoclostridium thermosuccinogenes]AUS95550.1 hypothetical protein CDO33_03295 [Pseudoclostridium thermosuccinogenes]PNT90411.1 hypothetical protein CDQ83_19330 [Pseudoclostridium thermosuccinogenes]PNT94974.1 hypothetical protein CDQ85_16485 [Pseudoclostridium thermosuccinogenes]PNT95638.1 hypothetical protein CDQ84_16720 [Pseudoclostridium thermosuccinogenes]